MALDNVKSAIITDLDASPRTVPTSGEGSAGFLQVIEGHAVAIAASSADSIYQLVRVRSNVKVKRTLFESAAQGAGAFDIGVYYATNGEFGRPAILVAAAAIDQDLFASAIDCASAVGIIDKTNESGTYTIEKRQMPLWEAAGLTSDPGGWLDICATVKTTAVTTGTGRFGINVEFVQ